MPTRSPSAVLRGSQVPRVRHAPSVRANAWEDVSDLAAAYGLILDEWQENVFEAAMGERSDGRWASSTVGVNVARQNGKGAILEARALAGLLIFDEKTIIHSAHEQKTARIGFERLLSYFENFDDLRKKVRSVMNAVNREHIKLNNGCEIHFPARSKGALRGFSIDCLLLDEAQILGDPAWEAVKPTLSARPNVQTWLLGTTPTPLDDSAVFSRMRERGIEGKDKRLTWCEWSAPSGSDISDPEVWAMANPALGARISQETIASEYGEMSPEGFGRERLSIWPDDVGEAARAIAPDTWRRGIIPEPAVDPDWPLAAIGIDTDPDGRTWVAMAVRSPEGVHVEVLDDDLLTGGVNAAVIWVRRRARRRIPVVMPGDSGAVVLEPHLLKAGCKVYRLNPLEQAQAAMGLDEALRDGGMTHLDDETLAAEVASTPRTAPKKAPEQWLIQRAGALGSAPLLAVASAHMGAVKWGPSGQAKTTSGRTVVSL